MSPASCTSDVTSPRTGCPDRAPAVLFRSRTPAFPTPTGVSRNALRLNAPCRLGQARLALRLSARQQPARDCIDDEPFAAGIASHAEASTGFLDGTYQAADLDSLIRVVETA